MPASMVKQPQVKSTKKAVPKSNGIVKKAKAAGSKKTQVKQELVKKQVMKVKVEARKASVMKDSKSETPPKREAAKAEASKPGSGGYTTSGKIDIGQFYAFAQCSLRAEAKELMGKDFELKDPEAKKHWPAYEKLAKQNLGKNEKWVPWHTVLGVHEHFLVDQVHHGSVSWWKAYHRFVAIFIFRCHCKRDLFSDVQMPHLKQQSFWKNLSAGFNAGSKMEKDILKFRATGKALQTSCFLIIPERILEDDDQNLVRNIVLRTQRLIGLAEKLWPIVNNKHMKATDLYDTIAKHIKDVPSLGDTWVKMLMVCIDIAMPELKLLKNRCEVGVGAADPLRKLLEDEGLIKPKVKHERSENSLFKNIDKEVIIAPAIRSGIVAVKRKNVQLIQVTASMAGGFDRAYAIAEALGKLASSKGFQKDDQEQLQVKRQQLFDDKNFKFASLGLEKLQQEAITKAANQEPRTRVSNEPTPSEALLKLGERINSSTVPSAGHFWLFITEVEAHARSYFKKLPLIVTQMKTENRKISPVTLQVQLCEFRQFQNFLQKTSLKRSASAMEE